MRESLDVFCDISGEQVSFPKSRVHCSNNVNLSTVKALAEVCGSPISQNLGNIREFHSSMVMLRRDPITKSLRRLKKDWLHGRVRLFPLRGSAPSLK
ncbi:hypothetical protein Ddye_024038 [Dipteronia dyeriana]|uniref:Uncharacterized protein n=1 Tax=Dipteronia dyeriana TaxID=168575 RepID=A0AAD9TU17_9ROSI|nr:hypothetical protein Ddye_024038 [Dipteronia dyeriana]